MVKKPLPYRMLTACLLALVSLLSASAQQAKMSLWVRQAAESYSKAAARRTALARQQRITAFVQTSTEAEADTLLATGGCRRLTHRGDISIASIPLGQLSRLAAHPAVRRIEAGRPASTQTDTIGHVVNTLPVYKATTQHQAYTGRGVVVGLMDVGFDLTHPNFYNDASRSHYRIGALWDQLSPDTIGSPLPVGRDYRSAADVLALRHSTDAPTQTHGTHTLGIAAGSGYDSPYRGVAYESDICLVANAVTSDTIYIDPSDYYKYTTATDAMGFEYLFDYADSRGMPCVASFSEGYMPYFDDDDLLFATYLERLTGPGHIIVAAAGNEGLETGYAEKAADAAAAGAFVRSNHPAARYRVKADGPLEIALHAYTGAKGEPTHSLAVRSDDDRLADGYADTLFLATDTLAVAISRYKSAFDGDTFYLADLISNQNISSLPPVAMVVSGAGTQAAIFGTSSYRLAAGEADARWQAAASGHNILAPACFEPVICVGSTSHRLGFTNYQGQYLDFSAGHEAGRRTPASSTGPTMDGRQKPDVMAPGDNVISSYSSYYLEHNPKAGNILSDVAHFTLDGRTYAWNANSGTSMACPVVAGIIALWLQARPTLSPAEVKAIFQRTCRHPDPTLDYPNTLYGHGEADAYRGLLDILGITRIEAVSQHHPELVGMALRDGQLELSFAALPGQPVGVTLYTTAGTARQLGVVAPGTSQATISLPATSAGIYVLGLSCSDKRYSGSWIIRK